MQGPLMKGGYLYERRYVLSSNNYAIGLKKYKLLKILKKSTQSISLLLPNLVTIFPHFTFLDMILPHLSIFYASLLFLFRKMLEELLPLNLRLE